MTLRDKKRILIFTTAYFPHVGGAEVAIQEITNQLGESYEFDLVCARYEAKLPRLERIGNVTVHRVGVGVRVLDKLFCPLLGTMRALTLHTKHTFSAYWAMMVTYGSGAAYITSWFTRVPIILTLQEGDPPEYLRTKWFGLIALSWRLALQRSARVTTISSYLATLAKEFGYTGEPILIPNGVDTARFSVSPMPHKGTVLITTSRLVRKNAVDDVIRALSLLPDEVTFVVYGTGPDEEKLRRLAKEIGVEKRVEFKGHASHQAIVNAFACADIFIRPSRSEGMGNSFIEAMAAGLPVIATQEGGISDFLFDAKRNPDKETTGWAVDKDSPEQIRDAVMDIMAHPHTVADVTACAQALVQEKYDWADIAVRMKRVFDQVTSAR